MIEARHIFRLTESPVKNKWKPSSKELKNILDWESEIQEEKNVLGHTPHSVHNNTLGGT